MSAYHDRASVEALIPPSFLLDALDDDRDGTEDAGLYASLADDAGVAVDAYLEGRVRRDQRTGHPLARRASLVFCLEAIYQRRGYTIKTDPPNPWAAEADGLRARLARIAEGAEPWVLDSSGPSVDTITEPSRTTSKAGRMGF